ncbi:hypothetical protein EDD27_5461 [Nonomuraea polychroma]|uniref:Uncharacterized protein n=1 Tax=Nonomuraea polychroma TaxID=46176 RepID=A0A438MAT9_9ACTN|nr:hypothetical protein EDD27_5461 [Nonomuraea polychroma]
MMGALRVAWIATGASNCASGAMSHMTDIS